MSLKIAMKPAKTFEEQLDILKSRGLRIDDETKALEILRRTNYYRLRAYWLSYEKDDGFAQGVSFGDIYSLYQFDMRLRHLILRILEQIEIAFRTQIAYEIAHMRDDPLGYMDASYFKNPRFHQSMLEEIEKELGRSKELFVPHHIEKYAGKFPVWAAVEVMSFGALSKMYSNLTHHLQRSISRKYYRYPESFIKNWLQVMSVCRNRCAHYGRLYNHVTNPIVKLFSEDKERGIAGDTLFAALIVMGRLSIEREAWSGFVIELMALIEQHDQVDVKLMGFPDNWKVIIADPNISMR